MEPTDLADGARSAAEVGGNKADSLFREELTIETKTNKTDVVTRADREAEAAVIDCIRDTDTTATIVAEESADEATIPDEGRAWIIDPIDGTNNYVRGIPLWVTAVAVVEDRQPIAAAIEAPELGYTFTADTDGARMNGEPITVNNRHDPEEMAVAPTFWWPTDRRAEYGTAASEIVERFGDLIRLRSAQLTLALVARGAIDATFTNRTMNSWDSVAGAFLIEQAGGSVTDIEGDRWEFDSRGIAASNGEAHDQVLAAVQAVESVRSSQ